MTFNSNKFKCLLQPAIKLIQVVPSHALCNREIFVFSRVIHSVDEAGTPPFILSRGRLICLEILIMRKCKIMLSFALRTYDTFLQKFVWDVQNNFKLDFPQH